MSLQMTLFHYFKWLSCIPLYVCEVKVKVKSLSHVRLFVTPWIVASEKAMAPHSSTLAWKIPWTAAYQAPPSMGFSRQEYWSGLPLPSPK